MHAINLGLLYDVNGSCLRLGVLEYTFFQVQIPLISQQIPRLYPDSSSVLLLAQESLVWRMLLWRGSGSTGSTGLGLHFFQTFLQAGTDSMLPASFQDLPCYSVKKYTKNLSTLQLWNSVGAAAVKKRYSTLNLVPKSWGGQKKWASNVHRKSLQWALYCGMGCMVRGRPCKQKAGGRSIVSFGFMRVPWLFSSKYACYVF